jgi:hypothetical protein
MKEFYDVFAEFVDPDRLREHVEHRASIKGVRTLLFEGGFDVVRVVQREGVMRFANGTALLNHHFIKLGFLDGWKSVAPDNTREVFARLRDRLDQLGELRLTIPMAYIEARA